MREAFNKEYEEFYKQQEILFNEALWNDIDLSELSDLSVTSFYTSYTASDVEISQ